MKKYIIGGLVAVLVIMQFFTIDKTTAEVIPSKDLIEMYQPSAEVKGILKSACYDCHSNQTEYPWYTNIAPLSWWIAEHIEDGRKHLNFSIWGDYELKKKKHKIKEVLEEVGEGEMPLDSYTWIHGEANLTVEQKDKLLSWFKGLELE